MNTQLHDVYETPPVDPAGEPLIQADPAFAADCMARARALADGMSGELGIPIVTRSERWGPVWRVDFTVPGAGLGPPLVNRIICWIKSDGAFHIDVALGQSVARLGGAADT
jgi:hypothetical protein